MNAPAPAQMRRPKETGVPENTKYLHPTLAKNHGNWKYHDRPRPGVLHHVSHSGDEVWSVRAGTARQMDVHTIRKLCSIADKFAEGHVRFTIRSNIEFMVSDEKKVAPLIEELGKEGGWLNDKVRSSLLAGKPPREIPAIPKRLADAIVDSFLATPFEGGRHQRRIDLIDRAGEVKRET